jgi:hypothetical protein
MLYNEESARGRDWTARTDIAIPRVFEVFNLTEGKRDGPNPLYTERSSIDGYRGANSGGGGPRLELI